MATIAATISGSSFERPARQGGMMVDRAPAAGRKMM